ncbi:MAG: hypothetical protein JSS95_13815 [Acidobacteria bacterium]|nr:hypothetical protein [Acidobacteriota bacterium]
MTDAELKFLKTQIDEVVLLETEDGGHMLARLLVVFDEGDTPDLFCLEVEPTPSGYVQKGATGHSILLADIASVTPAPSL